MISILKFEHGEDTCASEPGKFCRFLGTKHFGMFPSCMLFDDQPLSDSLGWVRRCDQCKEEFK